MSMSQAFAFNAESWQSCIDAIVQLSKVFRHKDERYACPSLFHLGAAPILTGESCSHCRFQGILNEIRQGACSDESRRILNEYV